MEKRSCDNCRHGSKANVRGKFNCPKGCRGLGPDNPLWATHWSPIEPKDC